MENNPDVRTYLRITTTSLPPPPPSQWIFVYECRAVFKLIEKSVVEHQHFTALHFS